MHNNSSNNNNSNNNSSSTSTNTSNSYNNDNNDNGFSSGQYVRCLFLSTVSTLNVGFCGGRKTGGAREKLLGARTATKNRLNPDGTRTMSGNRIQATAVVRALTTVSSMFPKTPVSPCLVIVLA